MVLWADSSLILDTVNLYDCLQAEHTPVPPEVVADAMRFLPGSSAHCCFLCTHPCRRWWRAWYRPSPFLSVRRRGSDPRRSGYSPLRLFRQVLLGMMLLQCYYFKGTKFFCLGSQKLLQPLVAPLMLPTILHGPLRFPTLAWGFSQCEGAISSSCRIDLLGGGIRRTMPCATERCVSQGFLL